MTRRSLPWRGAVIRQADGWAVTVPVRREHVAPEVRIVGKETLRVRREVVRGTAWLPYTVAGPREPRSDGQPTSGSRGEQKE